MRWQSIGLALLAMTLTISAAADDKPAAEDEGLYGTWTVTAQEAGGQKIETKGTESFVFDKGGKLTMKVKGEPDLVGTWKSNGTKAPKTIDLRMKKMDKSFALIGVYELDGDTLKMAYNIVLEGWMEERPSNFDSKTSLVVTLKRQKP